MMLNVSVNQVTDGKSVTSMANVWGLSAGASRPV